MNPWTFSLRLAQLLAVVLVMAMVAVHWFVPLIKKQKQLSNELAAKTKNVQETAEYLRRLKLKQEKLQEDPRFIEKIAREELGFAKPGETVFRFEEDAPY